MKIKFKDYNIEAESNNIGTLGIIFRNKNKEEYKLPNNYNLDLINITMLFGKDINIELSNIEQPKDINKNALKNLFKLDNPNIVVVNSFGEESMLELCGLLFMKYFDENKDLLRYKVIYNFYFTSEELNKLDLFKDRKSIYFSINSMSKSLLDMMENMTNYYKEKLCNGQNYFYLK